MTATSPNAVRLHCVFAAKPEKVYRAFLDADALARWLPPDGFTAHVDHLDAKIGGTFRMAFTNFSSGDIIRFGGTYLELVPRTRIRYTDRFDDPNLPGEMDVSIDLREVVVGTEVNVVQSGIPAVIPLAMCTLG